MDAMKKNAWYKQPEMIVALSALVVSLVTTVVSIYSAHTDRQYAKASVWPQLEMFHNNGPDVFELTVTNRGNGPAIIKYARVEYEGRFPKSWRDFEDVPDLSTSVIGRRTISPGQEIKPLRYAGDHVGYFMDMSSKLNFTLCYCSIYDECWTSQYSGSTHAVEHCDIPDAERFLY